MNRRRKRNRKRRRRRKWVEGRGAMMVVTEKEEIAIRYKSMNKRHTHTRIH